MYSEEKRTILRQQLETGDVRAEKLQGKSADPGKDKITALTRTENVKISPEELRITDTIRLQKAGKSQRTGRKQPDLPVPQSEEESRDRR